LTMQAPPLCQNKDTFGGHHLLQTVICAPLVSCQNIRCH